ncbi:MAG: ABC transporter permease [Chloroflexota bacterium]
MDDSEVISSQDDKALVASQWQLVWWRFRKHRIAMISAVVVILFYTIAAIPEFLAINDPQRQHDEIIFMPPQDIHFDGWQPFVYGIKGQRNPDTFAKEYVEDTSIKYYVEFFAEGYEYTLWGIFPSSTHLFSLGNGITETGEEVPVQWGVLQHDSGNPTYNPVPLYPLGTDRMGRDMWSRVMYGTRISLSIGLIGVLISLFLGLLLGGVSGLYGGLADNIIQRVIEFLRSMPTIPLWLSLGAAVPLEWSVLQVYFAITVILSLIGWTGLAREVRGRFLALREEDFIMAARFAGAGELRIIFRHMIPSFLSHIIATLTLSVPTMIISETALSYLGLGLRPPAISWGILLFEAQNLQSVAGAPWLLLPGAFVVVSIMAFNFLGDGLRDAADPYG